MLQPCVVHLHFYITCFDSNMYLGVCDYEIEVEVDDTDIILARMLIEELGLNSESFLSKSERFFRRLESMQNEYDSKKCMLD